MRTLIQGNVLLVALLFLLCMLIIVPNHVCLYAQVHQQCLIEPSLILQHGHALRNVLLDIWQILTNLFVLQAALLFQSFSFSMRYQDHAYKYALKDTSPKSAQRPVFKCVLHHQCTLLTTSTTPVFLSALQVTLEISVQVPVFNNAPKQPSSSQTLQ